MNRKKVGIHLDNWYDIDNETWDILRKWDPASFVVMPNVPDAQLGPLAVLYPHATIVARKPYDWQHSDRNNVADYANGLAELVARIVQFFPENQVVWQAFNEPNMPRGSQYEGFGQFELDMIAYERAWFTCYDVLKEAFPLARAGWGALTIGNMDVRHPEAGPDEKFYMEVCQASIKKADVLLCHVYNEDGEWEKSNSIWYGRRFELYQRYLPTEKADMPIIISECSMGDKIDELRGLSTVNWLQNVVLPAANVESVCLWIGNRRGNGDPSFDRARFTTAQGHLPIVQVVANYVKEEPPMPIEQIRRSLMVWYADYYFTERKIIDRMLDGKQLSGLIPKAWDGQDVWRTELDKLAADKYALGQFSGIWGYCYGGPNEAVTMGQAVAFARTCGINVVDVYVDVEGEVEGLTRRKMCLWLFDMLNTASRYKVRLHWVCLPRLEFRNLDLFHALNSSGTMTPQLYYKEFEAPYNDWGVLVPDWNDTFPLREATCSLYKVTPEETRAFEGVLKARGCEHILYFRDNQAGELEKALLGGD